MVRREDAQKRGYGRLSSTAGQRDSRRPAVRLVAAAAWVEALDAAEHHTGLDAEGRREFAEQRRSPTVGLGGPSMEPRADDEDDGVRERRLGVGGCWRLVRRLIAQRSLARDVG